MRAGRAWLRVRSLAPSAALAVALAALGGGCGTSVEGDFDGVPFLPAPTAFAIADRHDLLGAGGTAIAVRRSDENMRLDLVLTGAVVPPEDDWRHYPAARLLSLKKDLATLDGVHVKGIPLARALAFDDVEAHIAPDGTVTGDFDVSLVVALPEDERISSQGLGTEVDVKVVFQSVEVTPRGGLVAGLLEVKRARAEGQQGEVATGEVTARFAAPLLPERLGKSNLSLLAPVMACAAAVGPVRAGGCRDEPPLPYVDASGTLTGP